MSKILDIWPTVAALAADLAVPYPTVASWVQRGIPPRRFAQIIEAARKRGVALTFEQLLAVEHGAAVTAPLAGVAMTGAE